MKHKAAIIAFPACPRVGRTSERIRVATAATGRANADVVLIPASRAVVAGERLHSATLGNKLQTLAIVHPRAMGDIERLTDRLLDERDPSSRLKQLVDAYVRDGA
jgi:hypothetical protein